MEEAPVECKRYIFIALCDLPACDYTLARNMGRDESLPKNISWNELYDFRSGASLLLRHSKRTSAQKIQLAQKLGVKVTHKVI